MRDKISLNWAGGETGIHASFRNLSRKGWRFESSPAHMIKGVDYTGVCIIYFCHDAKGNFIMAKRSPQARDERGRWDIGGAD